MYGIDFANPWIVSADAAHRRTPPVLAFTLALVLPVACVLAARALGRVLPSSLSPALAYAILIAAVFTPLLTFAVLAIRFWERRPQPSGAPAAVSAGAGLLVGGGGFLATVALIAAAGALHKARGAPTGAAALAGIAVGLLLIALQAGTEEVLYRGWLQPILMARWGPWAGLVASAAAFAAVHWAGGLRSPVAGCNIALAGVVFGLLALRSGGLWAPFAAHLAWNGTEQLGLGLDPNPGLGPFGAVADFDIAGAPLWAGGTEGANGGLALTCVLAMLVVALTLARRRAPAARSAPVLVSDRAVS